MGNVSRWNGVPRQKEENEQSLPKTSRQLRDRFLKGRLACLEYRRRKLEKLGMMCCSEHFT